jgi:hypothetical protein
VIDTARKPSKSDAERDQHIGNLWEGGHSERELAKVFDVTPYRIHKAVSSRLDYRVGKDLHKVKGREIRKIWNVATKVRSLRYPKESKKKSREIVRYHSMLGLRALYDPSEMAHLMRVIKKHGTPTSEELEELRRVRKVAL